MKNRFVIAATLVLAIVCGEIRAQVKGLNKEEQSEAAPVVIAPEGRGFQVSPDGKKLAFFGTFKDVPNVFVVPINGGEIRQVSYVGDAGIESFYWAGDNHIVFRTAPGATGNGMLYESNLSGEDYRLISAEGCNARVVGLSAANGVVFFEMNSSENRAYYKFYSFQAGDTESRMAEANPSVLHRAPDLISGVSFYYEYLGTSVRLIGVNGDKMATFDRCSQFVPVAPSYAKKMHHYCLSDAGRSGTALVEMNPSTAKETNVLFHKPACSVTRVLLSPRGNTPLAVWYEGKERGMQAIDANFAQLFEVIKTKIQDGGVPDIINCSSDENVWIISSLLPDGRKFFYRYNVANKELRALNDQPKPLGPPRLKPTLAVESVKDSRGMELLVRFYTPSQKEIKYPAFLVFADRMWSLPEKEQEDFLIDLCMLGFPVIEVDLLHSESYGTAALGNGYDWWAGMLVSDIPSVITAANKRYIELSGFVPLGIGIGAQIALRAINLFPDLKTRSVFMNPFFTPESYLAWCDMVGRDDKRFILKPDQSSLPESNLLLNVLSQPLIVHSTADMGYNNLIDQMVKQMTYTGINPEFIIYAEEHGTPVSIAVRDYLLGEITRYANAVQVRKMK